MKKNNPRVVLVDGIPVARVTVGELLGLIAQWLGEKPGTPRAICYLNAHTANLAADNAAYRRLLLEADLVYADGMSVVRASRGRLPERVNAADFLLRFLWMAHARGWRVAVVAGREDETRRAAARLEEAVPGFKFSLVEGGFFGFDSPEEADLLARLEAARPDILLAGMGSPRQEQWTARMRQRAAAPVIWNVGALFEYFAGRPRAPAWMRQAGLEWVVRLVLEPRRLASRYLIGNLRFLARTRRAGGRSHLAKPR